MLREVGRCPWCGGKGYHILYPIEGEGEARRCNQCDIVYASKVLSDYGLKRYWSTYESESHMKDARLAEQRKHMYEIEHKFVKRYINPHSDILDIGCAHGGFLDLFHEDGHNCEGTEFGEEAYRKAATKYKVYFGDLKDINIENKYDLVIFRGVIQYLLYPKEDLLKAIHLLKPGG